MPGCVGSGTCHRTPLHMTCRCALNFGFVSMLRVMPGRWGPAPTTTRPCSRSHSNFTIRFMYNVDAESGDRAPTVVTTYLRAVAQMACSTCTKHRNFLLGRTVWVRVGAAPELVDGERPLSPGMHTHRVRTAKGEPRQRQCSGMCSINAVLSQSSRTVQLDNSAKKNKCTTVAFL